MANTDNPTIVDRWKSWEPQFLALLRIAASLMFINAGTVKLFGFPDPMPPGNEAAIFSQTWIGGVLEVFGGALLLIGLFTRPLAFVMAGAMAVAYFQFHFPMGFYPSKNGGVAAALYCFVWLYFSSAGAGAWSLDNLRAKK
jgi:putative oxidoreductase